MNYASNYQDIESSIQVIDVNINLKELYPFLNSAVCENESLEYCDDKICAPIPLKDDHEDGVSYLKVSDHSNSSTFTLHKGDYILFRLNFGSDDGDVELGKWNGINGVSGYLDFVARQENGRGFLLKANQVTDEKGVSFYFEINLSPCKSGFQDIDNKEFLVNWDPQVIIVV